MSKAVAAIMDFFGWGQSGDTLSRTETVHNFQASEGIQRVMPAINRIGYEEHGSQGADASSGYGSCEGEKVY